jgi:beta-glucanase (GH16 family)
MFCCVLPLAAAILMAASAPVHAVPSGYKLVWSDEFNGPVGSEPNPSTWNYDDGPGYANNGELEFNTVTQADCHIVVDPKANGGKALQITATPTGDGQYQSVRMNTRGKYSVQYGYIEARMKIPAGQGMWPAFWLLGNTGNWPDCGEIDVMENVGKTPTTVYGSIHGPGYTGAQGLTTRFMTPSGVPLAGAYHTYGVEWKPGMVRIYLDGKPYVTYTPASLPEGSRWCFDSQPFYIIVNLAVGGFWPGNPDATTVFPAHLMVNYIRVYKLASSR